VCEDSLLGVIGLAWNCAMFSLHPVEYAIAFVVPLEYAIVFVLSLGQHYFACAVGDPGCNAADQQLTSLPLPPGVDAPSTASVLGIPTQTRVLRRRTTYLPIIVRQAQASGLPPALVDAVVRIESEYKATMVGRAGEIGLMQVRPSTAAGLGFRGSRADLAEPETNLRVGVDYLAKAWRLADGNLCRTLVKYRAGHHAERLTPASARYCEAARVHMVATGTGPSVEPQHNSASSFEAVLAER
jgi:hypothetical protein